MSDATRLRYSRGVSGATDETAADDRSAGLAQAADALEQAVDDLGRAADDLIDELAGVPTRDGRMERFDYQGATILVETRGHGPRTFLLVHGIGMGRKVFADLTRILEADSTVIAVDLPGFGEAPEPPRTPTIERMADHIAAYLRERSLDPVVIGHSMGTQVVIELAARHPDLVDRIVLVGPTVDVGARSALTQLIRLGRDLLRESPRVLLLGAREYLRAGPNLRRKMTAMLAHRPEDSMPRIRARTLVLRGENDPVCPEPWCRSVADGIPGSQFREVPQRGHETLISDADPSAELILGWLDETP